MYFSNGDRLSYEGFKLAKVASLSNEPRVREEVGREAALVLRKAALHWRSSSMVCQGENSPLKRATTALISCGQIGGVVDVVIATASHFGGTVLGSVVEDDVELSAINSASSSYSNIDGVQQFGWEIGLYHVGNNIDEGAPTSSSSSSSSSTTNSTNNKQQQQNSIEEARTFCYNILLEHLRGLLNHQNDEAADELLSVATASEDKELHNAIYTFLWESGEIERMVRINSPILEKWLKAKDADLLWRFYIVHDKHQDAAHLMSSRAMDETNGLNLDKRITCLTRSVMASEEGGGGASMNNVVQLRERLEVAGLQRRLLDLVSVAVEEGRCEKELETSLNSKVSASELSVFRCVLKGGKLKH